MALASLAVCSRQPDLNADHTVSEATQFPVAMIIQRIRELQLEWTHAAIWNSSNIYRDKDTNYLCTMIGKKYVKKLLFLTWSMTKIWFATILTVTKTIFDIVFLFDYNKQKSLSNDKEGVWNAYKIWIAN